MTGIAGVATMKETVGIITEIIVAIMAIVADRDAATCEGCPCPGA